MVDWKSTAEVEKDGLVFSKFMHALLGLYIWEWATSLGFDWEVISRKRKFRWPLIFYFLNRYCLLFALIGIATALNVTDQVNCQGLYTFNQCFGNASIGFASINLSLRTMAVWSQKWYVVVPLIAIILAHWSLLLHGILLKATYVEGSGCVITQTDNGILAATFIYTMCFDFIVLCLTGCKLYFPSGGRSRLVSLIFQDGLIYFVIAFLANLLATIFMLLDLNAVMSIIANVPAAIASTIVACRVVRRLNKYTSEAPERFHSTTQGSTLAFRSGTMTGNSGARPKSKMSDGLHMDTFPAPSTGFSPGTASVLPDDQSFVAYDASGKLVRGDAYDPEAQIISDEFKRPPY
ncbi:hypothetical protein FISHEDRAFT_42624 [Fistulina hepatica ATCC 64428]|uniref:Transmembrane protein n=1 Tax=Fistulina hepatica ATCC 64428 TaxID=1128425 RepID=A0A0D7AEF6_9AGAR|nr:hypothetical protein FISHEDRAFT_42624 [Fistulina hepatica ATCC 64428]